MYTWSVVVAKVIRCGMFFLSSAALRFFPIINCSLFVLNSYCNGSCSM